MKRLFTAAMLLVITTITANAQLVINELMQSNVECFFDNDTKEFPDSWVELYNSGDSAVHLQYYMIGTKADVSKAWELPDQQVSAKGRVVIFCDKEGLENNRLHTDFRLESGKDGNLYLFQKEKTEAIDKLVKMAKMPAPDIAYGRAVDGGDTWGYQLTPSPGKTNTGIVPAGNGILGAPVFSVPGQVISGNATINLELSLPEKAPAGTIIRYTMDGSEPKPTDTSDTSIEYDGPIEIKGTTVIRAKLFHEGWLSPVSTAQSYIFHPREMKVPVISILTKNSYLNDSEIGIIPNNNGKYDQVDWRRPINIELFKPAEDSSVINQLGETRIQGGKSRENDLKSMAIYANKRFDPDKKRFEYEFFPDQKPGIDQFKSFSLRNGGNDFTDLYFRDLIVQRTMGENTDLDWQAGHTAVLYINGEYMGMLNIRERSNEDNIYSNYDGLEDIDEIEISHEDATGVDEFIEELKEGDMENYNAFKVFYSEKGHTLAQYEQWMDVSEYLNFVIMNLFYGNNDWPGNNTVFWRPNKDDNELGLPTRWRVIAKDTDFGLGLYNKQNTYNMIDLLYNPQNHPGDKWAFTEPATRLLKNMLEDPGILNLFIDKCCVYMGDFMNGEGTGKIIDKIQTEAIDEFVAHREKYPNQYGGNSRQDLLNKFSAAKNWAQGRPNNFITHMKNQWNLGTPITVTINKELAANELPDEVYVNGIKLTKSVFDGKLFPNRQITIVGKTNVENDLIVTGWEIVRTPPRGRAVTNSFPGDTYTFTMDNTSYKSLEINAIMGEDPRAKVVIGPYGAVSFSSTKDLDFTDQPVEAYIVTAQNGNKFIKEQVYKVPANTGLVIEGAKGTYRIPVADTSTQLDDVRYNMLSSTANGAVTVDDNGIYYGLFYSTAKEMVGFKKKELGFTFGIGKSYLFLTEQQLGKEMTEIFFGEIINGIATDIQGVDNDTWTDGKVYNLNGQRVDKNYNGVIIVNGKKVINNRK